MSIAEMIPGINDLVTKARMRLRAATERRDVDIIIERPHDLWYSEPLPDVAPCGYRLRVTVHVCACPLHGLYFVGALPGEPIPDACMQCAATWVRDVAAAFTQKDPS